MQDFTATFYTVTAEAITPTGKTELYPAETRAEAISHCLYTHRLHNGNARTVGKFDVIHCPTCGQIAMSYPKPETH